MHSSEKRTLWAFFVRVRHKVAYMLLCVSRIAGIISSMLCRGSHNACRDSGGLGIGIMPDHSARAIANEFLRRRASSAWPQQMLIQKLAYIAHGWNLAINGEPLIEEAAEAWDNGPVYRSVWDHIRDFGYGGPNCELTTPQTGRVISEELSASERSIIDAVWRKYAPRGASRLSQMTHKPDTPWAKAYFGHGRNSPLDNNEIREHYLKLAVAGRDAE